MNYLGNNYLFKKNLQGDIIEIWGTEDGSSRSDFRKLVTYTYDAWGNITSMVDTTDNWYRVGTANPFRYRGYYYDNESGLYYLQSRYYDPKVGRFLNRDDPMFLGANGNIASYDLFAYCENNPVNKIDVAGFAAINVIFAAVGAVVGWLLGDFVAKRLGYYSGWKYWAIRTGVVVGGSVIGWFAGSLLAKIIAIYLKSNPAIVFKITNKLGATSFHSAMKFLGINPFLLSMNSSKFIAIARLFNTKVITISYDWAVQLYKKAKALGFKITLDSPHNGYTWHIHISGNNGKLDDLHIQIVKKAWDYLATLLK